jgi:glycogen operon protein
MATANLQIAFQTEKGSPHPLGATPNREGVNFSLFSSNATAVELLLFKKHDDAKPFQTIQLDPNVNKTFHFWHVLREGAIAGHALRLPGERTLRSERRTSVQS